MQLIRVLSCAVVVAVLIACPTSPSVDAGVDAGVEDAGFDAGVDAGEPDAGVDGGEGDAGAPDAGPPVEICGDWLDNDGDGGADCADLACAAEPLCLEDAGTCASCGQACVAQSPCVAGNYHDVKPLPLCSYGVCVRRDEYIRSKVVASIGNAWVGAGTPRSGVSRFIKKTALDGTAVSCATLEAFTAANTDAAAIETSGRFNVQGYDIQGISNFAVGGGLIFNDVNTQTGGEFLLWVELWSEAVNGQTWYPNGTRKGHACLDDPNGPLEFGQNCDTGSCRAFSVSIPNPD